jgi:hypothetical protein
MRSPEKTKAARRLTAGERPSRRSALFFCFGGRGARSLFYFQNLLRSRKACFGLVYVYGLSNASGFFFFEN